MRKLSKIATLLLAKNHILMQANALEELRRIIAYMNQTAGIPVPTPAIVAAYEAQNPSSSSRNANNSGNNSGTSFPSLNDSSGPTASPIISPSTNHAEKARSPLGVSYGPTQGQRGSNTFK